MRALLAVLLLGLGTPALAQVSDVPPVAPSPRTNSLQIGAGVAFTPDYEGSNDYRIIPAGLIRAKIGGISIQSEGLGLSVDAIDLPGKVDFDLGPVIQLNLNRTGKIRDDIVDLLPERDIAVEFGAMAGVTFREITNPFDSLSFRVTALSDIAHGHQSTVVTPSATFSTPLSTRTFASLSASGDIVTSKYARYYFGVTPAESLATGGPLTGPRIRAFDPDGGLKNIRATLFGGHSLSGDLRQGGWGLFGILSYSRLLGDFKRSPLVADRGSASQWVGAAGVGYSW